MPSLQRLFDRYSVPWERDMLRETEQIHIRYEMMAEIAERNGFVYVTDSTIYVCLNWQKNELTLARDSVCSACERKHQG